MSGKSKLTAFIEKPYGVAVIALLCSVLWGSVFPSLKVTYQELGLTPSDDYARILLAGLRFILAGLVLLLGVYFGKRSAIGVPRKLWPGLFLSGVLQITFQYYFFFNGLARTSGVKAAILDSAGTFFVVILAHFMYQNDRLNGKKVFGLLAGFIGIVLANWGQEFGQGLSFQGEGFLILGGLSSAIATLQSKKLMQSISPFVLTGWQMIVGSLLLLMAGMTGGGVSDLHFTPLTGGLLFYMVLLSAVAFSLWYSLLQVHKAGEISIYKFMIPVAGTMLSALFISGEELSLMVILALGMVSLGIFVVNYRRNIRAGKEKNPLKEQKGS